MLKGLATAFLGLYLPLLAVAVALAAATLALSLKTKDRFSLGFGVLLVTAVLVPFHLGNSAGGFNAPLLVAGALCVVWLLEQIVRGRLAVDRSPVVLALLAFMAASVLSFVVGQYPWFPTPHAPMRAQVGGLGLFLLSGAVFLVVGHKVGSLAQLSRLTWGFIASGTLLVGALIVGVPDLDVGPVGITSSQSLGSMFFVWVVAMAASQALHNRDLPAAARLAAMAAAALALGRGLFLSFSWASGWLPAVVALTVIVLMRCPRTLVAALLLAVTPALLFGDRVIAALLVGEEYSWFTRVEAIRVMLQVMARNPWLGFGPANYHYYTLLFPFLGWWAQFNTHNNYLDLLAQTGLIGTLAFLWFAVEVFRAASKLRRRVPDGFARAYVVGVVGGLAGSLIAGLLADWIIPFAYNIGIRGFRSSVLFWFFLGGLLAIKRMSLSPNAVLGVAPLGGPLFQAAVPLDASARSR